MFVFRSFLLVVVVSFAVYTAVVGATHGWNLFPVFFGDIAAMTWPGQVNLDFLCMLLLSGLWIVEAR